jgi:hypothetical protein
VTILPRISIVSIIFIILTIIFVHWRWTRSMCWAWVRIMCWAWVRILYWTWMRILCWCRCWRMCTRTTVATTFGTVVVSDLFPILPTVTFSVVSHPFAVLQWRKTNEQRRRGRRRK